MSTLTTIVTGRDTATRELAIAAVIVPGVRTALILEGLPDGTDRFSAFPDHPALPIARIAPGCLCCTGNLVMRVTLNRILRQKPQRLFIGVASTTHLDALRSFLMHAPYDALLATPELLDADARSIGCLDATGLTGAEAPTG